MTKPMGFAAMSPEKHRAISRLGGRAVHESGRGHKWTSETARAAGSKGGVAAHAKRRKERGQSNDAPDGTQSAEVSS